MDKRIFLFLILQTFIFANTLLESNLVKEKKNLNKQLNELEENHRKTAKLIQIKTSQYENFNISKYIGEIDMRREKLHPNIAKSYNKIGLIHQALNHPKDALKSFKKGLRLSYTILDDNSEISKTILENASKGLTPKESMQLEIDMRAEVLAYDLKNFENTTPKKYSHKVFKDYLNLIRIYQYYKHEDAIIHYQNALTFFKNKEKNTIYTIDYAKLTIKGVKDFNLPKKTLKKAKKLLVKLPENYVQKKLLGQIEELESTSYLLLSILFSVLIFLLLALLYYFKIYYNPLVKRVSTNPKQLLLLTPTQLKKVKLNLQILLQWADTLRLLKISNLKVKRALIFYKNPSIEEFIYLVELKDYKKEDSFYLLKNIEIGLNINKLLLLLTEENLSIIKEKYLSGERIFIISHEDYQDEIASFCQNKNNNLIAPTSAELTELLLSQNPHKILANILTNCLSCKYLSPYQTKGAIHLKNNFFGRTEIIRDITTTESSNYFLVGARQLGKSSILKALERYYQEHSNVECYYFSLEHGDILQELSMALNIKKKSSLKKIVSVIKARKRKLIFLIDEADLLSENEECMQISSTFRKLSEENNAMFIFTDFRKLYQSITMNYHSPLKNFAELIHLGELEKQACEDLMLKPMQRLNISYENPNIVGMVIKRCGNRANLIAMVCDNVLKELNANVITQNDVDRGFMHENIYTTINGWQGLSTDKKENRINRLIVYLTFKLTSFSLGDVMKNLKEKEIELSIEEIEVSLQQLSLSYVLKKENNLYGYQVPMLKEFLLEEEDMILSVLLVEFKSLKK